jgi:hypothetical protein
MKIAFRDAERSGFPKRKVKFISLGSRTKTITLNRFPYRPEPLAKLVLADLAGPGFGKGSLEISMIRGSISQPLFLSTNRRR